MSKLEFIYSDNYLKYDLGADNPISRTKTRIFLEKLRTEKKFEYEVIEPEDATEQDLLLVHTPAYLAELKRLSRNNLEADPDTPVIKTWSFQESFLVLSSLEDYWHCWI